MQQTIPRTLVLGVPIDIVSEAETLEFIRTRVETKLPAQIVTVNVEFVVKAQTDPTFAQVLQTAQLATADSAGIVWALRRQGIPFERRVGGSDLIWTASEQAARLGHRVFFLGGEPGVAQETAARIQARYPDLHVAGWYPGSPDPAEDEAICDLIRSARTDILFVAFGAPRQDLWIARNLPRTGASVAMGVGGSFDYVSGRAKRAPRWMRDSGLDWAWRLIRQPWRAKRMIALPRFVWLIMRHQERTAQ